MHISPYSMLTHLHFQMGGGSIPVMDTEIELKFLLLRSVDDELNNVIQSLGQIQSHRTMRLHNCYFDTPTRTLRDADIGLRIRTSDQRMVQTIKTSGSSDGGLHQRPEYNIEIASSRPNLHLFDEDIWPQNFDVEAIQTALIPLFQTNFERTVWLLTYDNDTVVEIAYDQGSVVADDKKEPILELELELVSGTIEGLFRLAKQLIAHLPLRLSDVSKAARGYRMVNNIELKSKASLDYVDLPHDASIEKGFIDCISHGLRYVQYHEAVFFSKPSLSALKKITDGFSLIRHSFWLFSDAVSRESTNDLNSRIKAILVQLDWVENARQLKALSSSKGKFRKKLQRRHELLHNIHAAQSVVPTMAQTRKFFYQSDYCLLMLELAEWLELRLWRKSETVEQQQFGNRSIGEFAQQELERSWQDVVNYFPDSKTLGSDDYLENRSYLSRSLLTGVCFGGLFDPQRRMEYRRPWLDMLHGINELQNLIKLNRIIEASDLETDEGLIAWLEAKIASLLLAMEQSRHSGFKVIPYWH